jgi:elongation factor Ts
MTTGVDTVKELRERTGAGIMDCKSALKETGGDIEKAIDFLRKKGMASAAKRAGRDAKEGLIVIRVEGAKAAIVETNCETDFVARTEDFKGLAAMALDETFRSGDKASSNPKIQDRIAELSGKIGEKIVLRRTKLVESAGATLFHYLHANQKLGVVVELSGPAGKPAFAQLGKDLAMQVAASNPLCIRRSEVPAESLEREKAIYREEIKGKPENIVEKILEGKLGKFYQGACLLEQPFIKDDKLSVTQLIEQVSRETGAPIEIKRFVRFQLGEQSAQ